MCLCILHHTHPPKRIICNFKTHYHIKGIQYVMIDRGNLEIKGNRQSSPKAELSFWSEQLKDYHLSKELRLYAHGMGVHRFYRIEVEKLWEWKCPSAGQLPCSLELGLVCGSPFQRLLQLLLVKSMFVSKSTCGFKVISMSLKNNVELSKIIMLGCLTWAFLGWLNTKFHIWKQCSKYKPEPICVWGWRVGDWDWSQAHSTQGFCLFTELLDARILSAP